MLLKAVITAFPSVSLPFLAVPLRSHMTVAIRTPLQLHRGPQLLLELRPKGGRSITGSCISATGEWVACADAAGLRLYRLRYAADGEGGGDDRVAPQVAVTKVPPSVLPGELDVADATVRQRSSLLKAVITAFPSVSLPFLAVPLRSQPTVALRAGSPSTRVAAAGLTSSSSAGPPARSRSWTWGRSPSPGSSPRGTVSRSSASRSAGTGRGWRAWTRGTSYVSTASMRCSSTRRCRVSRPSQRRSASTRSAAA
eukprot:SAG22_NODE_653_length_8139_cov_13.407711_3_plen_254_part_00